MQPMPEPTIAEIRREVAHMTYIVGRYGERYRPILDSLTGHLEARRRHWPSPERSMPKRLRPLPDRSEITDDTPLHLDTAARLAFPDGVVTGLALRSAAARGDLEYERLGSRIVTTLRFIREWRERNRHPAKASVSPRMPSHFTQEYRAASLAAAYRAAADLRTQPNKGKRSDAAVATAAALEPRLRAPSEGKQIKPKAERLKIEKKPRRPAS